MHEFWENITKLADAQQIIHKGGFYLILFVVFAETGLFFGFFLPGDYLLFLAGLFCSTKQLDFPIFIVALSIALSAIAGSFMGYYFGKFLGNNLENRKNSWFFKKENLEKSKEFFTKFGGRALILARFMPIIRTFSPIIAGTIKMNLSSFTLYNIIGGMAWGITLPVAGYFLGQAFPQIINYVHWIIIFFLAITTFAVIKTYFSVKKNSKVTINENAK